MRTTRGVLCGLLALVAAAGPARAEPINPKAGEWLICAASFSGDSAGQMAEDLAAIVRRDYKLPAYTWNRGGDEKRKQQEQLEQMRALCPEGRFRVHRIEEQYAVLVGGYKDMEAARKALDEVKKLPPPRDTRFGDKMVVAGEDGKVQGVVLNPFQRSFVVHNPLTPNTPPPEPEGPDPSLREYNAGESHSLLKCGKPWTLVVKTYQGAPVLVDARADTKSMWDKLFGSSQQNSLSAGAMQAREVANVLRKMGYDAYVLHTRYQSIVSVGGFDAPNDPKLMETQRTLANLRLEPFEQLFPQPLPMQVPRP
jgi:hypothetical protein